MQFYKANPPILSPRQQDIVFEIQKNGIYSGHIESLSERENILKDLEQDAERILRHYVSTPTKKDHMRPPKMRGIGRNIDGKYLPKSIAEFFISDKVLDVVNTYMGKLCRLNYVDAWYNCSAKENDYTYPTELWHRDHEDLKVFKIFIYLTEVDETTGAFAYIKGTHINGKYGHINPVNPPHGVLMSDDELHEILSNDQDALQVYSGKKGTLIASDVSGFHKGGRPVCKSRTVLVAIYTSDVGVDKHRYRLPENFNTRELSYQSRYALHIEN